MSNVCEEPITIKHEVAERCPYYDEDCKDVKNHTACWSYNGDGDPFPGVCPFIFGME